MKQKNTLMVGSLSAALLCAPAQASEFPSRWYVGIGGGVSRLEPDTDDSQYDVDESEDTAAKLVIGRDLSPRMSLELYLADLGDVTFKPKAGAVNPVDNPYVGYQVGGLHLLTYFYNSDGDDGRYYRDRFSLFAKLGAGTMENDGNINFERKDDLHVSLGLGAEGLIAGGLSWRLEVEGFNSDAAQASLSVVNRFGKVSAPKPVLPLAESEPAAEQVATETPAEEPVEKAVEEAAQTASQAAQPTLAEEPVAVLLPAAESSDAGQSAPVGADADGDGVADDADRCPDTVVGRAVDSRGCAFSGIVEGLYFAAGSHKLTRSAMSILDNVVLELKRYPQVALEVQAHTDNRGKAIDNLALSQRRAESVANYMIARGISIDRVRARGFGESRPAFRNATAEGRKRNRRVVFQTVEMMP